MSVISTINANLFNCKFREALCRSLLTALRCHGDRKYDFLFSVKSDPHCVTSSAILFHYSPCSMYEPPQWNFTSLNEFISSPLHLVSQYRFSDRFTCLRNRENYVLLLLHEPLVPQTVSRRPFMSEARVRMWAKPFGIWEGHSGTATGFFPVLLFSHVSIIPPLLHTHSSIYHPRSIMFFFQYFCFPRSVPFHHCSMLILPSTTHAL